MHKADRKHLHIESKAAPWARVAGLEGRLRRAAGQALASLPASLAGAASAGEITILLTSDKEVHALNLAFRGMDKPTNVLSFPGFERAALIRAAKSGQGVYAGDIAIAYATTAREARQEGKKLLDHVTHLTIHGILHLYGYDHDTPAKARVMERLEKTIMAALGLCDPYAPLPVAALPAARRAK